MFFFPNKSRLEAMINSRVVSEEVYISAILFILKHLQTFYLGDDAEHSPASASLCVHTRLERTLSRLRRIERWQFFKSELKSGSASAVTFLAALLLLRYLCLASAKLWMQGTRTTFICAGHCEPWLLRLRALMGFVFLAALLMEGCALKRNLDGVLCSAPTWLLNKNLLYFNKPQDTTSTRFTLSWWKVVRLTAAANGKLKLPGIRVSSGKEVQTDKGSYCFKMPTDMGFVPLFKSIFNLPASLSPCDSFI